jgi:peptidoglycan-associated lipoprotein
MENRKNLLAGLVVASALLAGCASTETDSSGQEMADTGSTTYSESAVSGNSGMGFDTGAQDPAMADLKTVFYFDFDQATLTMEARADLDAQIARLSKTKGPVRLEGHADERGTREYNMALGERRAMAVADYMALKGIARYRIETVSYGEERPAAYGQDSASYAKNRRVELK